MHVEELIDELCALTLRARNAARLMKWPDGYDKDKTRREFDRIYTEAVTANSCIEPGPHDEQIHHAKKNLRVLEELRSIMDDSLSLWRS